MTRVISLSDCPTLRRARFAETEAAEHARDEQLLKERRALMACRIFGLNPDQLKPVSITSRATCEEDVVLL